MLTPQHPPTCAGGSRAGHGHGACQGASEWVWTPRARLSPCYTPSRAVWCEGAARPFILHEWMNGLFSGESSIDMAVSGGVEWDSYRENTARNFRPWVEGNHTKPGFPGTNSAPRCPSNPDQNPPSREQYPNRSHAISSKHDTWPLVIMKAGSEVARQLSISQKEFPGEIRKAVQKGPRVHETKLPF